MSDQTGRDSRQKGPGGRQDDGAGTARRPGVDQLLLDSFEGPMAVFDRQGRVLAVNQAAALARGIGRGDLVGKKARDLYPGDGAVFSRRLRQAFDSRQACHYQHLVDTPQGARWYALDFSPLLGKNGKASAVRVACNDVTETVGEQQTRTELQEMYRLLVDHRHDLVVKSSLDQRLLFVSASYCRIFGKTREELLGKSFAPLVHPDDRHIVEASLKKLLSPPHTAHHVVRAKTEDGWRRFSWSLTAVLDENFKPASYVAVGRDITELEESQQKLAASEERFRSLVDGSPFGVVLIDARGRYEYVNPKFEELFGWSLEDIPDGRSWFAKAFPNPKDRRLAVKAWYRELGQVKKGDREPNVFEVSCRDGLLKAISFRTVQLSGDRLLVTVEDVTRIESAREELKNSRLRYRSLADASFEAVFMSEKGLCLDANRAAYEMFGYGPGELEGIFGTDVIAPQDKEIVKGHMLSGYELPYEVTAQRKDGSTFPVEIRAKMARHHGREVRLTVVRDITDREQARLENQTAADIVQAVPSGLFIFNYQPPDRLILIDANPAAARMTGIFAKKWAGRELDEMWPQAQADGLRNSFLEVARTGETYGIENLHYEDGRVSRDYRVLAFAMPGSRLGITFEDITESVKAESALRESEQYYRSLFEQSPTPLFLQDFSAVTDLIAELKAQGVDDLREHLEQHPELVQRFTRAMRIVAVNQSAVRLYKAHDAEDLAKDLDRILVPGANGDIIEQVEAFARGESWYMGEAKNQTLTGETIEVLIYKNVVPGHEEDMSAVMVSVIDVTELHAAHREREKLEVMLRQAKKMEAIGTLAGGIAHDFNNILAAIMGYGELALDAAQDNESNAESLAQIIKAAGRARDLVKQILTFSRKAESDPRPLDLNREITHAAEMLKRTIPKMVDIKTKLTPSISHVSADPSQIQQVILNLAANAADAMPEGGVLTIETSDTQLDQVHSRLHPEIQPGRYVLLEVSDTGVGMDGSVRDQMFDPFFTTKSVGKGTGLGLATVYGIVKGHGGHIYCYSELERGTAFKIFLPAMGGPPGTSPEAADIPGEVEGGSETILLVDDEPALRELGQRMLTNAGYLVLLAESGEQALEILSGPSGEADLVVMDLGMPGMGGYRALRKMLVRDPAARILIASGYGQDDKVQGIIQAGAAGFIAKPFRMRNLLSKVREALDADTER